LATFFDGSSCVLILTKRGSDMFWAIFSHPRPVTLPGTRGSLFSHLSATSFFLTKSLALSEPLFSFLEDSFRIRGFLLLKHYFPYYMKPYFTMLKTLLLSVLLQFDPIFMVAFYFEQYRYIHMYRYT
jgi:hypothetical protein